MKKPDPEKKPMANEIKFPDDFEIPEGDADGTFEFVARAKKYDDGRYCIIEADGVPLKKDKEDAQDDMNEPMGSRARKAMAGGGY